MKWIDLTHRFNGETYDRRLWVKLKLCPPLALFFISQHTKAVK